MNRIGREGRGSDMATTGPRGVGRWVTVGALTAALAAAVVAWPATAEATLQKEGTWPAEDPVVTLNLGKVSRAEALSKLAEAAKWNLVMVEDPRADDVVVQLADAPASAVLEAILADGDWVASRNGNLVRVGPRAEVATPPPSPPPMALPTRRNDEATAKQASEARTTARDVSVTGDSVRIGADETVRDVTVMGGSAEIQGHATGDVAVVGGSVQIREGAHVEGDVQAVGGSITIQEGARVDGEVSVVGGVVIGAEHAKGRGLKVAIGDGEDDEKAEQGLLARAGRAISNAVSSAALLFVLGAVLIALAGDRFDQLRGEIAARSMRSVAMGLVGFLGTIFALLVLCVTVIGIPFAAVGVLLFIFAVFAGAAAAATTAGAAIAGHRIRSAYGHLAVGCGLYLVAGLLPWVGGWVQLAMILAGYGAIVSTRAAGLIRRRPALAPASPYR